MANEITIQAGLTLQRSNITVVGSDSKPRDQQSGTRGITIIKKAITSAIDLFASSDLNTLALYYAYVKNLDGSTASADIFLTTTSTTPIARLKAGDFCLVAVPTDGANANLVRAARVGGSGNVDVMLVGVEGT